MEIENRNTLIKSLNDGVNLFLGAGFSVLAKDEQSQPLPTGQQLCNELKKEFNVAGNYSLPQIATILERKSKTEFYSYLYSRFSITEFSDLYFSINDINTIAIYSTNIDNLVHKIFEENRTRYLNDLAINGPILADKTAVDYSALHGSIVNKERPLIFDSLSISTTFSHSPHTWNSLTQSILKYPTIFLGYGLADSGVFQVLSSVDATSSVQKEKWILLRNAEQAEYFKSLGFNIIVGDTKQFLEFIKETSIKETKYEKENYEDIKKLFPNNVVPESATKLKVRPINDFFLGNPPIWSDIFSKQIAITSHYSSIM